MCVTSQPAIISDTMVLTTALNPGTHMTAYQNKALSHTGDANCMFLHLPGDSLHLVQGIDATHGFMSDVTQSLPRLQPIERGMSRSGSFRGSFNPAPRIEEYGDYRVVFANKPEDTLTVLDQLPPEFRPTRVHSLELLAHWYKRHFEGYGIILVCWRGTLAPTHPVAVSYEPFHPEYLFAPGVDGHDGNLPQLGAPIGRGFKVAFSQRGRDCAHTVSYREPSVGRKQWAPLSVSGFNDDRSRAPNGDYWVRQSDLYLTGVDLAEKLVPRV